MLKLYLNIFFLAAFGIGTYIFFSMTENKKFNLEFSGKIQASHTDFISVPENNNQDVNLRIQIDKNKLEYKPGEHLSFRVLADQDGYITLWDVGSSKSINRLFPNKFSPNNMFVKAGEPTSVGGETTDFEFEVEGPAGMNTVYAIWTKDIDSQPKNPNFSDGQSFAKDLSAIDRRYQNNSKSWASSKITFEVLPHKQRIDQGYRYSHQFNYPDNVYVVAMGASTQNLQKSNQDAQDFAAHIKQLFPPQKISTTLLIKATRNDFINALEQLNRKVTPNDLVFIYFSGHGFMVADDNGDEQGGNDAVFVMYDYENSKDGELTESMVIRDDKFAQLVNRLNTNNIISVIDACHSGGMQKGLLQQRVKYFNGHIKKDAYMRPLILSNQGNFEAIPVADEVKGLVLAAAEENDFAIEAPEGSIFTNALLAQFNNAMSGDSLMDIFARTRSYVKQYTRKSQVPIAIGDKTIAENLKLGSNLQARLNQ